VHISQENPDALSAREVQGNRACFQDLYLERLLRFRDEPIGTETLSGFIYYTLIWSFMGPTKKELMYN
jgi:hypothetical protein